MAEASGPYADTMSRFCHPERAYPLFVLASWRGAAMRVIRLVSAVLLGCGLSLVGLGSASATSGSDPLIGVSGLNAGQLAMVSIANSLSPGGWCDPAGSETCVVEIVRYNMGYYDANLPADPGAGVCGYSADCSGLTAADLLSAPNDYSDQGPNFFAGCSYFGGWVYCVRLGHLSVAQGSSPLEFYGSYVPFIGSGLDALFAWYGSGTGAVGGPGAQGVDVAANGFGGAWPSQWAFFGAAASTPTQVMAGALAGLPVLPIAGGAVGVGVLALIFHFGFGWLSRLGV